MQENQRVTEMAYEVLVRQAKARVERTGEPLEVALKGVLETEAGRQLSEVCDGPYRGEKAKRWHEDLPRERARKRRRLPHEARQSLSWGFVRRAAKMSTTAAVRADHL